ncbi:RrF2 family transcriptional regulator [Salininema proteolyticum]|uniref:RrF2 family transcriptional regulator n=1 Tax=Salininema proteolyticum TaxID=1607685 RepID=A0ABV8TX42_9ACTN
MRLTAFTDVSLRILLTLATIERDTPTTREVAEAVAVPYTHAAKAVARLGELGLVHARRGRGGGLRLTAEGREASVGWIVRELEGPGDVVGCEGDPPCPLNGDCVLRGALARAKEAFMSSLDPVTIEGLAAPRKASAGRVPLQLTRR